jgi:hypothetical protein
VQARDAVSFPGFLLFWATLLEYSLEYRSKR